MWRQHGAIARWQLLERGYNDHAINHWVGKKRLHPVFAGVYAGGRPELSRLGMWMASVLASGRSAVVSHEAAGALWGIWRYTTALVVSVPAACNPSNPGVRVHRRTRIHATTRQRIPVTTLAATLVDLALRHPRSEIEAALNAADLRNLISLKTLREVLDRMPRTPGLARLKAIVDRRTFTFTRSELERAFVPIAKSAGLPKPLTRVYVNGYEVDFHFPEMGLVVETDGGSFHRTPFQQATDRKRDHAHLAAGMTPLRFTHGQIRYERADVRETLTTIAARLVRA